MRPSRLGWFSLGVLVVLASSCGKARSNPPDLVDPNDVLAAGACYPLGHAALAESLAQPLAVGRDVFGTVYALSRAGATTLLWRSWDDRLIAYPVVSENRALGGAIFGADDGNRGYALTLIPEASPSTLRVFHDLELAQRNEGFAFTTGGATLEVLGPEALAGFTVASESSPALVVGSFRTVPDDAPSASLLLVRTGPAAGAQLALFYGQGTELEQRELRDWSRVEDRFFLRFELDGAEASAVLDMDSTPVTGSLSVLGEERTLQRGLSTPLGLAQLSLRCLASAPAAWLRPEPAPPPAAESCAEALPLFACASTTGPRVADVGPTSIAIEAAQVVELGSGESQAPEDTPDFELLPGPERCVTRPECGGAVSGYALSARPAVTADPADTGQGVQIVGYGERVRQGDYYIYNGGLESATALPLCTYKPSGNARIAIWKAPGD